MSARVAAAASVPPPPAGEQDAPRGAAGAAAAGADAAATPAAFSRDSPEDRALLLAFLLHAADLCTPLFPPPVSRRISDELSLEFARQAELERQQGLPVTVMVAADDVGKAKVRSTMGQRGAIRCAGRHPCADRTHSHSFLRFVPFLPA